MLVKGATSQYLIAALGYPRINWLIQYIYTHKHYPHPIVNYVYDFIFYPTKFFAINAYSRINILSGHTYGLDYKINLTLC